MPQNSLLQTKQFLAEDGSVLLELREGARFGRSSLQRSLSWKQPKPTSCWNSGGSLATSFYARRSLVRCLPGG
jgi:hypothetical protein